MTELEFNHNLYYLTSLQHFLTFVRFYFQYCHVGRLSHEVGWKYRDVLRTLEGKRRVKTTKAVLVHRKLKVNKLTTIQSMKLLYKCFKFLTHFAIFLILMLCSEKWWNSVYFDVCSVIVKT